MDLIEELSKIHGCRLVSLLYRTKESKELSRYLIALGVSLERTYRRDEHVLRFVQPRNEVEAQAKRELLDSLQESIKNGIGNNNRYTCKGVYQNLFSGAKYHVDSREVYLYGYLLKKEVIEEGEYKEIKSKPLTIAKNQLRKRMKLSRFRQFAVCNIKTISFDNHFLILQ